MPVLKGKVKRATINLIVEHISTRLASWKSKLLNRAGKLCLAQSLVSVMPTYTMQSLWLPETVCANIDKLSRGFIWGKKDDSRGIHLVKWSIMTMPKKWGGLGIKDSKQTNVALHRKVAWNILNQPAWLSSKVLIENYLGRYSIFLTSPKRNCSYVWQGILKVVGRLRDGFKFRMGTGDVSI